MLLTTLALVSACTPKDEGDSDPAPGSSSTGGPTEPDTGPGATDTGPGATDTDPGATDTDPGATDTDPGATDPGATDPGATDPGATDPGATDTDPGATDSTATDDTGDDTGPALPEQCVAADPAVSATYTLAVVGWPVEPATTGELDAPCTVDAVVAAADIVTTTLTCEIDGEPHAASLVIAAAPEGPVGWAASDPVRLIVDIWDEGDFGGGRNVQLRAADDALLLSASEAYIDEGFDNPARYAPLKVKLELVCHGWGDDFTESPLRMDITPVDGPVVGIFSGHRGIVPIDAAQVFAVDVEEATADCCHLPAETKVLLRRVDIGG